VKPRAVVREAWRNTVSGSARSLTLALSLGVLVMLLAAADNGAVAHLLRQAADYRSKGASVTILIAEGLVDGHRCDRLADLPGVRAAGAIRATSDRITGTVLPTAPIPVSESTAGFLEIVREAPRASGVLLGPDAADAFGIDAADEIVTASGTTPVAGTYDYPDDGRRRGLSYAAIAPTADSASFDECWVDAWPQDDGIVAALLTTARPATEDRAKPEIAQLNSTLGRSFDGAAAFASRPTRFAAGAAAAGGLALGLLGVRLRRLQLASALHAGVSRRGLLAISVLEACGWVALCGAVVVPGTVIAAHALGGSAESYTLGWGVFVAGAAGAFAGTCAGVATTHERHLFRYFKAR